MKKNGVYLRNDWEVDDQIQETGGFNLNDQSSQGSKITSLQRQSSARMGKLKKIKSTDAEYMKLQFQNDHFVAIEEEAAIINYYINSQKKKKEDDDEDQLSAGASKLNLNIKKTMMELIAESMVEHNENTEKLKKLLDWNSLDVKISKIDKEKKQKKQFFEVMHYSQNKPKKKIRVS